MTTQPTLLSGTLRRDAKLLVLAVDGGEQLVLGPASMCGPDLDLRGPGEVRVNVSGKRHPGSCTCLGKHGLPHLELDWMRVDGVPLPGPCEIEPSESDVEAQQAQIREAIQSLAGGPASVVGLVVDHRGWSMQLLAVNVEENDAYGPYKWQATTTADPVDDGPCDCVGRGMTPMEALDRCADEAEDAESFDDDDCDDGEPDEEDEP